MSTETNLPIAVIDYGAGNLRSVVRALSKVGATLNVTSDAATVRAAPAVVLPGVGATLDTMQSLQRLELVEAIGEVIRAGTPFLGICVGMQVLCEQSAEFGPHACLGAVHGSVQRLPAGQKVPQLGWNQRSYHNDVGRQPLVSNIPDSSVCYFVYSCYCGLADEWLVAGTTDYGIACPSSWLRDN